MAHVGPPGKWEGEFSLCVVRRFNGREVTQQTGRWHGGGRVGGYWLVASDGGIFSFGTGFFGSAGRLHLAAPVAGMAASADGRGYWLVAGDGGVFTYGDATYHGSVPGQGIVGQPNVVGMTTAPNGQGYWLTASNGAVYSYGDAEFLGAPTGMHLVAPLAGIAASP